MAEKKYDNTNRGVLFKNDRKGDNEKAPDYKGTINVAGVDKEIAAWKKTRENGEIFLSISVSEPFKKEQPSAQKSISANDPTPDW